VYREPVVTPTVLFFAALAALGLVLAAVRFFSPLGPFSGMNDAYAWGIWKTFNVMTLTALGSGPLAVGIAAWVFNRRKLHVVMRTALVSGFLFYATGLLALGFDVGRPWNFYSALLPWRWNAESAMLEISICMPLYCAAFLFFENIPLVLERFYYTGGDTTQSILRAIAPFLRRIYPFVIVGAYVLPLMHQSSLGGLLLLAGAQDQSALADAVPALALLVGCRFMRAGLYDFPAPDCQSSLFATARLGSVDGVGQPVVLRMFSFSSRSRRRSHLARAGSGRLRVRHDEPPLFSETTLILIPAVALRSKERTPDATKRAQNGHPRMFRRRVLPFRSHHHRVYACSPRDLFPLLARSVDEHWIHRARDRRIWTGSEIFRGAAGNR
jgi:hypothetical protein